MKTRNGCASRTWAAGFTILLLLLQPRLASAALMLLASDWYNDQILSINPQTSQHSVFVSGGSGGIDNPAGLTYGPSGNLLVASGANDRICRFDGPSGASLGIFATGAPTPIGMKIGPDGYLYVACRDGPGVYRYNATTGQSLGTFATASTTDLWWAYDLVFLADGDMLVSSFERGSILRFNGSTGEYMGKFSPAASGYAAGLAFGPTGDLFVARYFGNTIDRIDPVTGESKGVFALGNGLNKPSGITFAPDGRLYVANERSTAISVFDAYTGSPLGTIAIPGAVNTGFQFLLVVPEPSILCLFGCGMLLLSRAPRIKLPNVRYR